MHCVFMIAELTSSDRSNTIELGEKGTLRAALRVRDGLRKTSGGLRLIAGFDEQFSKPRLKLAHDD